MKVVLTIAGTDPSGAAGIQADLQTIRDHGCHGVSVVTSVLAQNTQGVSAVLPLDPPMLAAQLHSVFDDFAVAAIKVGLVPTDDVLDVLKFPDGVPVVWDPVLVSGDSQTPLFAGTTERLLEAARRATVITPNVPELEELGEMQIQTREQAHAAACALSGLGPDVLLKVGHLASAARRVATEDPRVIKQSMTLSDIWAENGTSSDLTGLVEIDDDVRGTGCQLSAALACNLAGGQPPREAAEAARSYLNDLLNTRALKLGRGRLLVVRN